MIRDSCSVLAIAHDVAYSMIAQPTAEEKANSVNGKYVADVDWMRADLVLILR